MLRITCLVLLLFNFYAGFSQSKRDGYKKVFLDSSFVECDSVDAFYYAYGYFEGLREITYFKSLYAISCDDWTYTGIAGVKSEPVILNGTLTCIDNFTVGYDRHHTREEDVFVNGYIYRHFRCELKDADTIEYGYALFDSLYQDKPGSHYYKLESKKDTLLGYYRDGKHGWDFYSDYDSRGLIYSNGKYPYWKGKVPIFLGVAGGLEGFRNPGYEVGIAVLGPVEGGSYEPVELYGATTGVLVSYKNRFDNSYYSINSEWGIYAPFSFGLGHAYHNNGLDHKHVFQMFTGITLFHLQMLYGYSFYKNSKNEIPELFHHTFTIRYVLPVWRI